MRKPRFPRHVYSISCQRLLETPLESVILLQRRRLIIGAHLHIAAYWEDVSCVLDDHAVHEQVCARRESMDRDRRVQESSRRLHAAAGCHPEFPFRSPDSSPREEPAWLSGTEDNFREGALDPLSVFSPPVGPSISAATRARSLEGARQQARVSETRRTHRECRGGTTPPEFLHIAEKARVGPQRCQILEEERQAAPVIP